MNDRSSTQFLRFAVVNSVAAVANIGTKTVCGFFLIDPLAVLVGFCVGLSSSYLLCRNYVFQPATGSNISEMARFTAVNMISLGITYGTYRHALVLLRGSFSLTESQPIVEALAYAIGVVAPVIFSFMAQKTLTLRQRLN